MGGRKAQLLLALQETTESYLPGLLSESASLVGRAGEASCAFLPATLDVTGTIFTILISAQSLILIRKLHSRSFIAYLSKGSYIYTAKMLHKSGFLVTSWSNVHRVPKELYD